MLNSIFLLLMIVFFVGLAGLFAGSETGLYRLSRLRLRLGLEKKRLKYILLGKCVHDGSGLLLSMLIGTNLSHYLATSVITFLLLSHFETGYATEIVATILTAPILFTFSELIPKNLFFYRADLLMPYTAGFLHAFHKLMVWSGAVRILRFISSSFAKLAGSSASNTVISSAQRHTVEAILRDTHEEGILSPVQTDIINRLVKISNVRIKSVMIPIDKVQTVDINSNRDALLGILKICSFTRLPVVDSQNGQIAGFINIYEVLSLAIEFNDLRNFIKPISKLDADTEVIDAINLMQAEHHKILLVTKAGLTAKERPLGILTMKDLAEELLGELAEW